MYLTHLRIQSWRTLREPVELRDLSPGLNIVFGPNETGKSTVMDAICRGFFDRHRSSAREMASRQPWDSDLAPSVAIEFCVGADQYRLEKKFLASPAASLRRRVAGRWEKLAEGQSADDRIITLTRGELPKSGLAKPEHWGLGQVLWSCQGEASRLVVGESQRERLRAALQLAMTPPGGEATEAEIRRRCDAIYTPLGSLRTGKQEADVIRLQRELADSQRHVEALSTQRQAADAVAAELQAAVEKRVSLEQRRTAFSTDLDKARTDLIALLEAQQQYQSLNHDAIQTDVAWKSLNTTVRAIDHATAGVAAAQAQLGAAQSAVEPAAVELTVQRDHLVRLNTEREDAVAHHERLLAQLATVDRIAHFLGTSQQLELAEQQLRQSAEAAEQLATTRRQLAELRAPDPTQLHCLRSLDQQRREQRNLLAAASLRITIDPLKPLKVSIETDGNAQSIKNVSSSETLLAAGDAIINIEGIGRISIKAGSSNATQLADAAQKFDDAFRAKAAEFGSEDLAQLDQLAARRQALTITLEQKALRVGELHESSAQQQRVTELHEYCDQLLNQDPSIAQTKSTLPEVRLSLSQMRGELARSTDWLASLNQRSKQAQARLQSAEQLFTRATAAAGQSKVLVDERSRELQSMRNADGLDDATRYANRAAALALADAARQRLAAVVKPPVNEMQHQIDSFQSHIADLGRQLSGLDLSIGNLQGQLDRSNAAGFYSQWTDAVEQAELLERQLQRARLDAEAIKLLRDTLEKHRRQAVEAVLVPVQQTVSRTLAQLADARYDRVAFDEQLLPARLHPSDRDDHIEPAADQLSYGTREQLMMLVRLALGQLMSRSSAGRQCVILDDPLVHADARRQQQALRILEEFARDTQIIVFTCHPQVYQNADAQRFDLESISHNARQPINTIRVD